MAIKKKSVTKKKAAVKKSPAKKPSARSAAGKKKATRKSKAKELQYVYTWGDGKADGNGQMKELLGGKGANLAEMTRIGLPVPAGFTITTEVCSYFYDHKQTYPKVLRRQMEAGVKNMEKIMGYKFGDDSGFPLLLAVRSGARDSMPGMMDTVLNLGLNDKTVAALAEATNNERFAWDCYRRFIQMYGDVVLGVQKAPEEDHEPFETVIEEYKHEIYGKDIIDSDLTADDNKEMVTRFKKLVKDRTGQGFPEDPWEQLDGAAGAVFSSWMNDRAIVYRRKYSIPAAWGTAVNVQAMVFGNTGAESGSGVAFTRDPSSGENKLWGEFLINAQGEDVVAGVRTPFPVAEMEQALPDAFKELMKVRRILEKHFKDVQDVEFTIQEGKLFMLQTRNGKRTAASALKCAADMVNERLINWQTAILRNPADQLDSLLAPVFDVIEAEKAKVIAKGLPAGPGAASGKIYLNADRAEAAANNGEKVLLVRVETSPEDLRGMIAAEGILTAKGGVSSHAALVARQMGKVCVCGAGGVEVNYQQKTIKAGGQTFKEGDYLSIDGTSGAVYAGELATEESEIITGLVNNRKSSQDTEKFQNFVQLMEWCSKATKMGVRTNADSPEQVKTAVAFGAEGIGLTRTEHMFFEGDRIDAMREMILATEEKSRKAALKKLLPHQRKDFFGIFKALEGKPATIRLLDPPLHEFLPHSEEQQKDLAKKLDVPFEQIHQRVSELHESNPMLGHRGCRLAISYPEIAEMQAQAIFEAAAQCVKKGISVQPEVMVPLVGYARELELQVGIIHRVAGEVKEAKGVDFDYLVGTMIEVPRGALTADEIAEHAQFFSFGTNDLTQTALGVSRDDMGSFLNSYQENDIYPKNPFASLDTTGVGQLMEIAVEKGRKTNADIKLGICGEHGGDPDSVTFCHQLGLAYVSCSPYRVPVARLAAAQAALNDGGMPTPRKKAAKRPGKKLVRKKIRKIVRNSDKKDSRPTSKKVTKKPTKKAAKKATKKSTRRK